MKTRERKPRPPASFTTHQAVIVAVDTAENSGWSLWEPGFLSSWGEINVLRDVEALDNLLAYAVSKAAALGVPCVLVLEQPFAGNEQGQYRGTWKSAFVRAGGKANRIVGVYPPTWRTRVLGGGWGSKPRDEVRPFEQLVAKRIAYGATLRPDEAAAVCIGLWAIHAGEVGQKLPRSRRPRATQGASKGAR